MTADRKFWMRLARMLGYTVEELQEKMGSREFTQWKVFLEENPELEIRADYHAAQICACFADVMTSKRHKIQDFLLRFKSKQTSVEDLTSKLQGFLSPLIKKD